MPATVAIISIALFFLGQLLVTNRCCCGFLIWAASNLVIVCVNLLTGNLPTAGLFATYFAANLISFFTWITAQEPSGPPIPPRFCPRRAPAHVRRAIVGLLNDRIETGSAVLGRAPSPGSPRRATQRESCALQRQVSSSLVFPVGIPRTGVRGGGATSIPGVMKTGGRARLRFALQSGPDRLAAHPGNHFLSICLASS